jgi:hypothetical protein
VAAVVQHRFGAMKVLARELRENPYRPVNLDVDAVEKPISRLIFGKKMARV